MNRWYLVSSKQTKLHYCHSYYLAQLVAANLQMRNLAEDLNIGTNGDCSMSYFWNEGKSNNFSSAYTIPGPIIVHIGDTSFYEARQAIISLSSDRYGGHFSKLHDERNILCLTIEQMKFLQNIIR